MNKIPMTSLGYDQLQVELKKLINEDRPNIIAAIAEARSHGDLSENAEYQYAKEQQSLIEGKIADLESAVSKAPIAAGTPLERMLSSGTSFNPRFRYDSGLAPPGAAVLPLTETTFCVFAMQISIGHSPPRVNICGLTILSTKVAPTAASTALPPIPRRSAPALVAR